MRAATLDQTIRPIGDGSHVLLVSRIRDEILSSPDRRITFARFMDRVLTEPGLGYYSTSDQRPTRAGDFLTAPELHPLFGRCIGRLISEVWTRLGQPVGFVVREWGAGRGTLATTALDGLVTDGSALAAVVQWQPLDLPGRHPDQVGGRGTGVVIANEYLDALPVHRLVRRSDRILERFVTWTDGWFADIEDEPSDPTLTDAWTAEGITLADGQLAEVRPSAEAWVRQVADDLDRGLVLVIDYGQAAVELYGPHRIAGTLMTYRDHVAGDDPFATVGGQDITAHVDISALERAAVASDLQALGSTTQARLLAGLGLGDLLHELGQDSATTLADYLAARSSVARLLDPRHLGGFRVLAFGRGLAAEPSLPGFAAIPPQRGA